MDHEETLPPTSQENARRPWLPSPAPHLTPWANKQFGPYRILEMLGQGGQGVVLKAHQVNANRLVALKLLTKASPRGRKRFRQEAQVLARLQHPNLIRVFDLGEDANTPFVAMEFVLGRSLDRIIEEEGPLPHERIVEVLGPIADALQYCHDNGIVHRDVKPENVLVVNETGRPVLVDFGLVQRDPEQFGALSLDAQGPLSVTGEIKGSPAWMAPEQANASDDVGAWTDVHALGGLLYFLLVGEPPFEGPNLIAVLRSVAHLPAPDPREENPDASPALAELCLWAMQKDPEQRPASAREFADVLRGKRVAGRTAGSSSGLHLALCGVLALATIVAVALGVTLALKGDSPASQQAKETAGPTAPLPAKTPAPPRVKTPEPTKTEQPRPRRPTQAELAEAKRAYDQAVIANRAKDRANALQSLATAIRLNPRYAEAYLMRGKIKLAMGSKARGVPRRILLEGAAEEFTHYLDLRPKSSGGWNNRGICYRRLGKRTWESALLNYRQAAKLKPSEPVYHGNVGAILRDLGRHEEALAAFNRAVALKPDYRCAVNRGHALMKLERYREAHQAYNQTLAILAQNDPRRGKVLKFIQKAMDAAKQGGQ